MGIGGKISRRRNVFKKNNIAYKDFIKLNDSDCVMVRRSNFYFWMAIVGLDENIDNNVYEVFSKYINIENMINFIHNEDKISSYYLMSVIDVKIIINSFSDNLKNRLTFFKSDVKREELNNYHNYIKNKFVKKKMLIKK